MLPALTTNLGQNLGRILTLEVAVHMPIQLMCGIAKLPNLELKSLCGFSLEIWYSLIKEKYHILDLC
jgi:hypothetical protein